MIRRPPRSTRTDTLFPYTTLFRSRPFGLLLARGLGAGAGGEFGVGHRHFLAGQHGIEVVLPPLVVGFLAAGLRRVGDRCRPVGVGVVRSAERRVGKECGSPCKTVWSPDHLKQNKN